MKEINKIVKDKIIKSVVEGILQKKVKDRTKEEHHELIKHYGGVREYLLSMGEFKDVPIDEETELPKGLKEIRRFCSDDPEDCKTNNGDCDTYPLQAFYPEKQLMAFLEKQQTMIKKLSNVFYSVPQPSKIKEKFEEVFKEVK